MHEAKLRKILGRVNALLRNSSYAEAIAFCDDALEREELCRHWIHGWKADVLWNAGRRDDAIAEMELARDLNPEWAGHWCYLALWRLESGSYKSAIEDAGELIALEERRGSAAFVDLARKIRAYAAVLNRNRNDAIRWSKEIEDEKPSWLAGKLLSKDDILKEANEL